MTQQYEKESVSTVYGRISFCWQLIEYKTDVMSFIHKFKLRETAQLIVATSNI